MSTAMGARGYAKGVERRWRQAPGSKNLVMMKLLSGRDKYKFALITKERTSFGKSVWRCSLTNTIRNFPSRGDAKRFVDDVEVTIAHQAKRQH
jgi:hypothetical protein